MSFRFEAIVVVGVTTTVGAVDAIAAIVKDIAGSRGRLSWRPLSVEPKLPCRQRTEQSRGVAECHFDLRRIRAAGHDVFLTPGDFENANGSDFETAMRSMDRISRYERRAWSKRKRALGKPPSE
jgi:hypothetical protein